MLYLELVGQKTLKLSEKKQDRERLGDEEMVYAVYQKH